jgi:hypothetical protein
VYPSVKEICVNFQQPGGDSFFHITILQMLASQALLMTSKEMRITGPHAVKQTYAWLCCHGWKVIGHPPFSPNIELASVQKR